MLDIKFVRENPELVKENIKKKFQEEKLPLVDEVIKYDAEARKCQQEACVQQRPHRHPSHHLRTDDEHNPYYICGSGEKPMTTMFLNIQ